MEKMKLKYRRKVTIIFIEYFVFAFLFIQVFDFFKYTLKLREFSNFFMILFICYLIYFSLFEFILKNSLVMWWFKVKIDKEKRSNIYFLIYTLSSILDRTIFVPFHILLAILNYENLLLGEKLSGIRWEYKKGYISQNKEWILIIKDFKKKLESKTKFENRKHKSNKKIRFTTRYKLYC